MRAERVVLDTNVLISAALQPKGPPRTAIGAIGAAGGVLLFSDPTFDELRTRLDRPKFDKYVSREGRSLFLAQLDAVSEWVAITSARMGCRDPDDDKLLETAFAGAADCLVTGDRDLLVMSPFHGIPILTPADFLSVV
jgi:putative PIN family toxin of toxin-antitoxin system